MADLVAAQARLAVVDFPEAETVTYYMIWLDQTEMDPGLKWAGKRSKRSRRLP